LKKNIKESHYASDAIDTRTSHFIKLLNSNNKINLNTAIFDGNVITRPRPGEYKVSHMEELKIPMTYKDKVVSDAAGSEGKEDDSEGKYTYVTYTAIKEYQLEREFNPKYYKGGTNIKDCSNGDNVCPSLNLRRADIATQHIMFPRNVENHVNEFENYMKLNSNNYMSRVAAIVHVVADAARAAARATNDRAADAATRAAHAATRAADAAARAAARVANNVVAAAARAARVAADAARNAAAAARAAADAADDARAAACAAARAAAARADAAADNAARAAARAANAGAAARAAGAGAEDGNENDYKNNTFFMNLKSLGDLAQLYEAKKRNLVFFTMDSMQFLVGAMLGVQVVKGWKKTQMITANIPDAATAHAANARAAARVALTAAAYARVAANNALTAARVAHAAARVALTAARDARDASSFARAANAADHAANAAAAADHAANAAAAAADPDANAATARAAADAADDARAAARVAGAAANIVADAAAPAGACYAGAAGGATAGAGKVSVMYTDGETKSDTGY
jgi:hypothetical protein